MKGGGAGEITRSGAHLIVLASGVLMGLTVAPVEAWPLAWVALAPQWVLVVGSAKRENPLTPSPSPSLGELATTAWPCLGLQEFIP